MSHLIYFASHVSGGAYIGLTSRSLAARRKEHVRDAGAANRVRRCPVFAAALKKHGPANFHWDTLIEGLQQDEAEHLEQFLISFYAPRYNVSPGGIGGKRGKRNAQTIERMRIAAKARGISSATRAANQNAKRKPVVCIETGTVFRDAGEAALAHGLLRSHVYDRLFKGRQSQMAGVSFRHALPHERSMMNVREAG